MSSERFRCSDNHGWGNDLSAGTTLPQFEAAYSNIEDLARSNIQSVVIPAIWPRADSYFNGLTRRHSQYFSICVTFEAYVPFGIGTEDKPTARTMGYTLHEEAIRKP